LNFLHAFAYDLIKILLNFFAWICICLTSTDHRWIMWRFQKNQTKLTQSSQQKKVHTELYTYLIWSFQKVIFSVLDYN
jgi:hypothetical protein